MSCLSNSLYEDCVVKTDPRFMVQDVPLGLTDGEAAEGITDFQSCGCPNQVPDSAISTVIA